MRYVFTLILVAVATAMDSTAQATMQAQREPQIFSVGGDVSAPVLIKKVEPAYSEEAHKAKLSGNVSLSLVVDQNGMPQHIRVVRGLGMGLDERAIEAVTRWRFRPAMKAGKPAAVRAQVEVSFRLQSPSQASMIPAGPVISPAPFNPVPTTEWPIPRTAEEFVFRGQEYMRERKYSEAIADADRALNINATYIPARWLRGQANYFAGNFTEAIKDETAVLEQYPDWAEVHYSRATAYFASGRPDMALPDYTDAIKLNPYDANLYNARGRAYLQMGQYEKALPDLNRAIGLMPGFVPAYVNRAKLFAETNQLQKESTDLGRILLIRPSDEAATTRLKEVRQRIAQQASAHQQ